MTEILIIFIEFLFIVILSLVIRGYVKERRNEREQLQQHYLDTAYKRTEHTDLMLKLASSIVLKLTKEMYIEIFKKNKIVKETCKRFYEELSSRLK